VILVFVPHVVTYICEGERSEIKEKNLVDTHEACTQLKITNH